MNPLPTQPYMLMTRAAKHAHYSFLKWVIQSGALWMKVITASLLAIKSKREASRFTFRDLKPGLPFLSQLYDLDRPIANGCSSQLLPIEAASLRIN